MTRLMLVGPILASILLAAAAQLTLKIGMSSDAIQRALVGQDPWRTAIAVISSPTILAGLFCFGLSALTWLLVLAKFDLSTAYPFIALGIVITVAAGYFLLGEPMSPTKLAGVATIVFGVLLIGISIPMANQAERHIVSD